jgi:RNA polymerase sigma-70 factor (ECF subfamily)
MKAEELHRRFAEPIRRLSRRMIRSRDLADDAAQETWAEIVKSLPSFRGESSPSTWIYTIARRTIMRTAAREKRYTARFLSEFFELHADEGLDQFSAQPDESRLEWLRSQCEACLNAILHCVHNDDRFIYLLRRVADLPYAEIAAVMEKSEAAVRQSASRSSRKIAAFLSGHCLLYNPGGSCRCKLKEPLERMPDAWAPVRAVSRKLYFLREADRFHFPLESVRNLRVSCHETAADLH